MLLTTFCRCPASRWALLAFAWTLPALPSAASAQVAAGQITGIVTDRSGTAAGGATVTLTNLDTSLIRALTANDQGFYAAAGLSPGDYRIEIRLPGFANSTREAVRVFTGETLRIDVVLQPEGMSEQVTVRADPPVLRTSTASLGNVVEQRRVLGLPLNGRTFVVLAALTPGVALPANSPLPRINGGRPRTNEYLFDGISVLQPEPGQVAFFPVIDAIREFKVESNSPPAEFGRFNGGVVNLTTRGGSNQLHGTLFEFMRHEVMNARHLFAPATGPTPPFRRNQFGGVLGGPLRRNATFFFVDYQGQRQGIARTAVSTIPTRLQRQGIFTEAIGGRVPTLYDPASTTGTGSGVGRVPFPGGAIPPDRIDPVARTLLERYPLPTSDGTANNYRRTDIERNDQDQWDARVDQQLRAGDRAFARLSHFREHFVPVTPLPEGSGVTVGTLGPQRTSAWATASSYQRAFSSSLLNDARFGDTRRSITRDAAQLAGSAGTSLEIPGIPATARFPNTLPTFLISGYQQLGSPPNTATEFSTSVIELADTLTWVTGRHMVKAGFDWRWSRLDVVQPPSPTGLFTFNALGSDLPGTPNTGSPLASFLLGQVQAFSIDLQQTEIQERARVQEYFVQDEWKASSRLTLTPGLRYTLNFPSIEINGQTAVFNLRSQLLEYPGTNPVRPLKKDNFGPRLGVTYAWSDRSIVSAGYGLVWIEMAGITTPFTTPTFPFLQTVSQRALDTLSPAFVLSRGPSVSPLAPTPTAGLGQGVFSVDSTLGSGYVQQWNAAFQRQLTANTAVEVAYVGSRIIHVGIPDTNLNQLSADQLTLGPMLLQRVANPYFGVVPSSSPLGDPTIPLAQLLKPYPAYTTVSLYRNNVGTTRYDGFELSVRRRFTQGLAYSLAYTRSKLIDDASSVFDASILTGPVANFPVADSFNRALERDYSTGDIPHVFVASAVWDIPVGPGRAYRGSGWLGALANDWTVAGIVTVQSGTPVAVTQTTNFNAFAGFGIQRPNLIGDPTLPASQRSSSRWFNTDAFAIAPQFTLGNSPRNPLRGPAYHNVDVALSRRLPIASSPIAFEVRAEVFNLMNRPALGAPNAVLGAANFGTITTAGDPRVTQLALKLLF